MKKITILILALILISCSKEESISEPDYSTFLNNNDHIFNFKTNLTTYNWSFESAKFQMRSGYSPIQYTPPTAIFMSGLISNDGLNYFNLLTPEIDISNKTAIDNVLSVGKKKFGDVYEHFNLTIAINKNEYVTKPNDNFELEILKKEEFLNYDNKKRLLVWIKINNLVIENINQNGDFLEIKEGFMVAEFGDFK
ncbi:hypothetical protein [Lutibacter sp.]|uniref:hypothetical protein n=1 Tax=Lutibacter sp. TaxID=1925666 RepID=UPI0027336E3F|nr:hypothetical protein [Lutibacter sp.]MDP3312944.1 hypothetical protein [Lutibacter sp.]